MDELKHYGVKGMKWDEDKKKQAEAEFDKLVIMKHLTKAQAARVKALAKKLHKVKSFKVSGAKKEVGKVVKVSKRTAETTSDKMKRVKNKVEKQAQPKTVTAKDRAKSLNAKLKKKAKAKADAKKAHDSKLSVRAGKVLDKVKKKLTPKEKKPHGKIVAPNTTKRAIEKHKKPIVEQMLNDLGIKKKSKTEKLADAVKSEAGIQYELAKAKAYQKTHNGEAAPFDPTNKNQWKALGRELGLTKSPAEKATRALKGEAGIQYELAKAKAYQKTHNGEGAPFDPTNKNQWRALARELGFTKSPVEKTKDKVKKKLKQLKNS
jgi:hypothetical protein